jgi:hypothetical protein
MRASEQNKVSSRRSPPACIRALFQWRKTTPRGPIFTKQSQRAKTLIEQHVMCEGGFTHMNPASWVERFARDQPSGTATLGLAKNSTYRFGCSGADLQVDRACFYQTNPTDETRYP